MKRDFAFVVDRKVEAGSLTKADTDLATANKYYKCGWIAYIIWAVLVIGVNLLLLLTGAFTASFETY